MVRPKETFLQCDQRFDIDLEIIDQLRGPSEERGHDDDEQDIFFRAPV